MLTKGPVLYERDQTFYCDGVPVTVGETLQLDDASWKVVGTGRSPDKHQTPFLWVRHETFGTVIFAPSLGFPAPHRAKKPPEKSFVPTLQYNHVWKEKSKEALLPELKVIRAYEDAKKSARLSALIA